MTPETHAARVTMTGEGTVLRYPEGRELALLRPALIRPSATACYMSVAEPCSFWTLVPDCLSR